jgi:hypothetical protein
MHVFLDLLKRFSRKLQSLLPVTPINRLVSLCLMVQVGALTPEAVRLQIYSVLNLVSPSS